MKRLLVATIAAACSAAAMSAASAQVKVGVTVSSTGPAASLGIPEKNAVLLMPAKIGKYDVEYIVLDDASDTSVARRNMGRFITENKVDIVIGSSTTPPSLAMVELAGQSGTPLLSLGAGITIIEPMDEQRKWVFKTPYNDVTTARATVKDMQAKGIKTIGFIGFNDGYGESWWNGLQAAAQGSGIEIVAQERYTRTDTSVAAQVLKVLSKRPDAVVVAASGTPAVLPQSTLRERGYKGVIYQTTGVANEDFLRVGGKNVEGTLIAGAPITVVKDLPDAHPAKAVATEFNDLWEAKYGTGTMSAFAGYAWDAFLLMQAGILKAGDAAEPGTAEFRKALRDAIEQTRDIATTNGLVNMSPTDHNGYSADAPAMITAKEGRWRLAQ